MPPRVVEKIIAQHQIHNLLCKCFVLQVRGLYRGVAAPLFVVTPTFAVAFGTYNCTSSLLRSYNKDNSDRLSLMQHFIAGASTAIPISIFVVPSERVKCILQAQNNSTYSTVRYTGSWDCARQLYTNGGLRSLYKGLGITLLRDGPGNGAYFAMYEMFRRISGKALGYENPNDLPKIFIVLGGGIAGIANWIVAIPFDVVKSRFQTAPEGKYFNARDVFKQIIKEEGFPALFRGMTPALLRACPANAATFVGVELTHNFLDHR